MITLRATGQCSLSLFIAACLLFGSVGITTTVHSKTKRIINASRVMNGPIQVDGRLDDLDWAKAEVSTGFSERTPNPGDSPPVETRIRAIYDDSALYIAVENVFATGETPRTLELRRDSSRIWADDAVTLKLDVAHDKRTSINLAVNSAGAQIDALALNNGRQFRKEFDAVWLAENHFTDGVWTIEYRIPYTALGLTASDEPNRILGINLSRDHNSRNAT